MHSNYELLSVHSDINATSATHITMGTSKVNVSPTWGFHPSQINRDVPDLCHVVPRPSKTIPGMPNVPDFKACSSLSTDNTAVQSWGHGNWQIGSIFIAELQMYRVWQPTNNCHQITQKCTKSHTEFQKFSGVSSPDARRLGAPLQTTVPDLESEKAATIPQPFDARSWDQGEVQCTWRPETLVSRLHDCLSPVIFGSGEVWWQRGIICRR